MFEENELPILGILRGIQEKDIEPLIKLFTATDIRYMEITMNTKGAAHLIRSAIVAAGKNIRVGAGTVLSMKDYKEATKAGASFIVSPSIQVEVIQNSVADNIPVFPGALTPTEVHQAWDMGATMVKLFPAGLFGPDYIKAVKGPFDKIRIMAVGGVNENNVAEYRLKGADGIAFGAGIVKPEWLRDNRYDLIENGLKKFTDNFRNNSPT